MCTVYKSVYVFCHAARCLIRSHLAFITSDTIIVQFVRAVSGDYRKFLSF